MLSSRDLGTLASKWECQVYQRQRQLQEHGKRAGSPTKGPAGGAPYRRSSTSESGLDPKEKKAREASQRLSVVQDTFQALFPDDFHCVVPMYCFRPVDELLRQWNFAMQRYIQQRALHELKCRHQEAKQEKRGAGEDWQQEQQQQQAGGPGDAWQAQEEGRVGAGSNGGLRSRRATSEQQQQQQAADDAGVVVARPCRPSSGGPRRLSGTSPATSSGGHVRPSTAAAAAGGGGDHRRMPLNSQNGQPQRVGVLQTPQQQQQQQQVNAPGRSSPRARAVQGAGALQGLLAAGHSSGDAGDLEMLPVTPRAVPPLKPHVAALEKPQVGRPACCVGCAGWPISQIILARCCELLMC
jgi:hypothetical protein